MTTMQPADEFDVDWGALTDEEVEAKLAELVAAPSLHHVSTGLPLSPQTERLFWHNFKCAQCGRCCTEVQQIRVMPRDVERAARVLRITERQFKRHHTVTIDGARMMRMPCVFHDPETKICVAYGDRPHVCKQFPINRPGVESDGLRVLAVYLHCHAAARATAVMLDCHIQMQARTARGIRLAGELGLTSRADALARQQATMRFYDGGAR